MCWNNQGVKIIMSSLVVQPYKIFFHPNFKNYLAIQTHVWVWVLHICQKHAFIIIIMLWAFFKNLNIKALMHKTEGLVKYLIVYFRDIKILSCHIISKILKQPLTCKWQRCVHIHHQNMHYHILNVCFVVLYNVHGVIFQVHNQIRKN